MLSILTCFLTLLLHYSAVLTEIPLYISNDPKFVADINNVIRQEQYRLLVLVNANLGYDKSYKETSVIVNNMFVPNVNLDSNSVGIFNGKYNETFSYEAITDETRLYLIFIANIRDIVIVLPKLKRIYFFRPRHRIIFITSVTTNLEYISEAFHACWNLEILYAALFTKSESFTFNPFTNEFALQVDIKSLFPDKLSNLHHDTLRMSFFVSALDVMQIKGRMIGRDISLWNETAIKLNASLKGIVPRDGITYGLILRNGTMTGAFADIVLNKTDLAMNSRLVKMQFVNLMEGTYPHDRDNVAITVPCAANESDIYKFLILFSIPLWIFVGIGMCIFGLLWWRVATPAKPMNAVITSLNATLGYPVAESNNVTARLIMLSYILYAFFLLAAYHGILTSVLTVSLHTPEINTLEQLEKSGLRIYAAGRFKDMFLANVGSSLTLTLVQRIERVADDPDINVLVQKRGHYAIVQKETFALQSVLSSTNFREDGSPIYRIMNERPMPSQVCYAARYGSALVPKINILLRRFDESGLNDYWKRSTIHLFSLDEHLGDIPTPQEHRYLTFTDLSLAFVILAFGLSIATFIFLCETCFYRWKYTWPNNSFNHKK